MLDPTPTQNNGDGRRVFLVDDGTATRRSVVIQGLTITGADSSGFGGGISSVEALTLRNMVIRNNAAVVAGGVGASGTLEVFDCEIFENQSDQAGGGIHLNAGAGFMYQIVGSTIRDNMSGGRGGGIYSVVPAGSTMRITDCLIANNTSSLDGGGIYGSGAHVISRSAIHNNHSDMNGGGIKSASSLTVENSLVEDNSADNGGGIHGDAIVTIRDSTVANNDVSGDGGGLYIQNGASIFTQVTISNNNAQGSGGGIYTTQAVSIRHSTIAQNRADSDTAGGGTGGGIFGSQPVLTPIGIDQTIIAGNLRGASTRDDVIGAVGLRYTLLGDDTGATITDNGNNQIGNMAMPEDPLLAALAANDAPALRGGYFVLTHTLQTGSPAIDTGDPMAMAGGGTVPTYDERGLGFGRVFNATALPAAVIDIGAVEQQPTPLFADYNADQSVNAADYSIWRNTLGSTTDHRADGDRNGVVNRDDFLYWKSHYGETAPMPATGSSVAETQAAVETVSPSVGGLESSPIISAGTVDLAPLLGEPSGPLAGHSLPANSPAGNSTPGSTLADPLLLLFDGQLQESAGNESEPLEELDPESPADGSSDDDWNALDGAFAEFGLGGQ
jgi:predicted outer membrane repeat protein